MNPLTASLLGIVAKHLTNEYPHTRTIPENASSFGHCTKGKISEQRDQVTISGSHRQAGVGRNSSIASFPLFPGL